MADGQQEKSATVIVGEQSAPAGRKRRLLSAGRKLMPQTRRAKIGALVVLVIIGGGLAWVVFGNSNKDLYAQVAGHKIYKQDVKNLIGSTPNVSEREAATVLADKYLVEAMAKEQGVTVTEADLVDEYGPDFPDQKAKSPYGYQNLINQLYFSKLAAHNEGTYKGKLLVANFSRNVPYKSALLAEQQAGNPDIGNPAAIAADKTYAEKFITDLYDQVASKKISFDEAIQAERNDPVVGEAAYPTQTHSTTFDGPLSQNNLLAAQSIRSKIQQMKPGQTSKPFVVRVNDSADDSNSTAESYFLVVQMDTAAGGGDNIDFPARLAQAKKHWGYVIYV